MINFMVYANHTRYMNVIENSYRDLYSLLEAYGPYPSFDDMAWYAISFLRIYEVTGNEEFLQGAIDIFNWCWKTGWDHTKNCSGGMYFDNLFASKASITNAQMYLVAAKLHRINNDTTSHRRIKELEEFIFENHLINSSNFLLVDNIDISNCSAHNSSLGWTYESGVLVGAFTEMYKLTKNETYLMLADKLAWATIIYNSNGSDVFVEVNCEPDNCNDDQKMYKGIFTRHTRYLIEVLPEDKAEKYWKWFDDNVQHIVKFNMCDEIPISKCNITFQDGPPYYNKSGPVFSPNWIGPFTVGAPEQQTSALDLFVSSIKPGTKCTGSYCDYSPYYPPPQPLTCNSHPCPQKEQCCEYSPYASYTCCTPDQKCNKDGICE